MNKQKDLIKIFEFLAEYLREEPIIEESPSKQLIKETIDSPKEQSVLNDMFFNRKECLNLIHKVDEIDKLKPKFDEPFMRRFLPKEERDIDTPNSEGVKN